MRISAATIDRRLAGERSKLLSRGRSHTKPGTFSVCCGEFIFQPIGERHAIGGQDSEVITETGRDR